jgi:hypothetical protein
MAKIGKERFTEEVTAYETKPQIQENPINGGLITGGVLLVISICLLLLTRKKERNGF